MAILTPPPAFLSALQPGQYDQRENIDWSASVSASSFSFALTSCFKARLTYTRHHQRFACLEIMRCNTTASDSHDTSPEKGNGFDCVTGSVYYSPEARLCQLDTLLHHSIRVHIYKDTCSALSPVLARIGPSLPADQRPCLSDKIHTHTHTHTHTVQ